MNRGAWIILAGILAAAALPPAVFPGGSTLTADGDLIISKAEVGAKAKFYPYKAGKITLEVIAVRAPDGTVRTALNTCQVCYASGRGYYTQQKDELVCNNCGNRFKTGQVELLKGGCNPVPITSELKTETEKSIVISKALLEEASVLFLNWKKR